MEEIALHVLDIAENSIRANATEVDILLEKDVSANTLTVIIRDNGSGMDEETLKRVLDPFFTTKEGKRTGLGLPLFAQSARECGGGFSIESKPGAGTVIRAVFALGHPDCRKLGNMDETVYVLKASHPEIRFNYRCWDKE